MCFFFQAEDGIRDLVRSRGLGDVYKRQRKCLLINRGRVAELADALDLGSNGAILAGSTPVAVSYTHLTLPTSDLV